MKKWNHLKKITLLAGLCLSPALAQAQWVDYYVDNNYQGSFDRGNDCTDPQSPCLTLAHAVRQARTWSYIHVAPGYYFARNLAIDNKEIGIMAVDPDPANTYIDGEGKNRHFSISNKSYIYFRGFTFINGQADQGNGELDPGNHGGSILATDSRLTVEDCVFDGNTAAVYGGAIRLTNGVLEVRDSVMRGNSANEKAGGGISLDKASGVIKGSDISGNWGEEMGGGISAEESSLRLSDTTVADNATVEFGGGVYLNSAGQNDSLVVNQSTLSRNRAMEGAGLFSPNPVHLRSSTIAFNEGDGIRVSSQNHFGPTTIKHTIIAHNSGGQCRGNPTSQGYNLSSDGSCGFNAAGDLSGTDPLLLPLAKRGGLAPVHGITSCSPAVDAGEPAVFQGDPPVHKSGGCTDDQNRVFAFDQRGTGFNRHANPNGGIGRCDIGAFELTAPLACTVCGNGEREAGEECDDGNRVSGDGCAGDCTRE